jgi:molecular chaperone GrpE
MNDGTQKRVESAGACGSDGLSTGRAAPERADARDGHAVDASGEECCAAADRLTDQLLRLRADFDNYRRRAQRDQEQMERSANRSLIAKLLPVLDDFEQGLATAEQHAAPATVLRGFRLVRDQLMGVLDKAGVTAIDAEGREFDPAVHEAIQAAPSHALPANRVVAETRRGYRLAGTLLRASQVVVSSGPPEAPKEPAPRSAKHRSDREGRPPHAGSV